jgi:SPP1 family predicted phage head-tail adaptor
MPFGNVIQRRVPTLFAGKLRQRIDIVSVSPTQDSTGGFDLNSDVVFANVWASVEPMAGTDKDAAGSIVAVGTYQIVIRYIAGVTSKMQVWFGGRQFQITSVLNPVEFNKMLVLNCVEINDSLQQTAGTPA